MNIYVKSVNADSTAAMKALDAFDVRYVRHSQPKSRLP